VHPNAALVESLYAALARRDGAAMGACYAPGASFHDPVFDLHGPEVVAMWAMLCKRARDLSVQWSEVRADDRQGRALWQARYRFASTGRWVDNRIESAFTFAAGRIESQRDTFDFRRWTRMAFGLPAALPGATPLLQRLVRKRARESLQAYVGREGRKA
jgi:ketosteroid isomerase-like protein